MEGIIEHFEKYFEVIDVNTPQLLEECRKLRYQTFCLEKHYFDASDSFSASETDKYDSQSAHSLILHKESGMYAATVRLVLPDPKDPSTPFPMECYLPTNCRNEYHKLMNAPREHLGEISRFMISKTFRQRIGEDTSIHGIGSDFGMLPPRMKRQFAAQISLGLFKAIVQMSAKHNIRYWLALMESSLIRLLARIGVHFKHLSNRINVCGSRHVCFENSSEILLGGRRQRPDIWAFATNNGEISIPHLSPPIIYPSKTRVLEDAIS